MTVMHHLQVCGVLMLALAASQPLFGRHLNWAQDIRQLSLVNRRVFQVHCAFIALILVMFGLLDLASGALLRPVTPLGAAVLGGIAVFWGMRVLAQFAVYDAAIWRGDRLRTVAHVLFSVLWLYLAGVHAWAAVVWRGALGSG